MAERIEIKDRNGSVFKEVLKYEGILWPKVVHDPVQRVQVTWDFPYTDDDMFVCSYPKTGSNWMLDMLSMLRRNTTDINLSMTPPLELRPERSLTMTSPRTLLTHLPFRLMPKSHANAGCKMILMHRNPKATAVSTYHFAQKHKPEPFEGSFEDFLHIYTSGTVPVSGYIQYYQDWDKTLKENPELPVLIVRYEDLKRDCVSQLRRVCDFLELYRTDAFLQEVADKNDINKVKQAKEADPGIQEFIKLTSKEEGKLHFYRKGELDDWKTHFTVAQSEQFDNVFEEGLKDTVFAYN